MFSHTPKTVRVCDDARVKHCFMLVVLSNATLPPVKHLAPLYHLGLNASCARPGGEAKTVVDVGAALGATSVYLATRGCAVTAVDASPLAMHLLTATSVVNHVTIKTKRVTVATKREATHVPVESNPIRDLTGSENYKGHPRAHVHSWSRTTRLLNLISHPTDLLRIDVLHKYHLLCDVGSMLASGRVRAIELGGHGGAWEGLLLPRLGFERLVHRHTTLWVWRRPPRASNVPTRCRGASH